MAGCDEFKLWLDQFKWVKSCYLYQGENIYYKEEKVSTVVDLNNKLLEVFIYLHKERDREKYLYNTLWSICFDMDCTLAAM